VFVKEHEGSAVQNTYLTYLTDLFKSTTFGSVNTKAAVPLPPALFEGWWRKSVAVGFWFDDIPYHLCLECSCLTIGYGPQGE